MLVCVGVDGGADTYCFSGGEKQKKSYSKEVAPGDGGKGHHLLDVISMDRIEAVDRAAR